MIANQCQEIILSSFHSISKVYVSSASRLSLPLGSIVEDLDDLVWPVPGLSLMLIDEPRCANYAHIVIFLYYREF